MGIFCLIMGTIVVIAVTLGLVGLWRLNHWGFGDKYCAEHEQVAKNYAKSTCS
jgi:hypothetical protein